MIFKVILLRTSSYSNAEDTFPDLDTSNASEIWAKYINRHTGRRSDAATGKLDITYIHAGL